MAFDLHKLHPRHWTLRVVWDVFMVWVALINLHLIAFDLTYLMLRPTYQRWVPGVVRLYDPVKGIEPHPLTEELLEVAAETRRLVRLDPQAPGLEDRVRRLRALTLEILETDPFRRSGQETTLEVFQRVIREGAAGGEEDLPVPLDRPAAVRAYWSDDPTLLAERLARFDEVVRPLMARNYFREIDFRGNLVDRFWLIDLPFLTLFIVEFAVRWHLAVRRREHERWYFFPIFNWYDLLGLIPYTQFRVFRLFRVASLYMRLRRSDLSRVGKDVLSRAVAYVSNIIAEEISDAVSIRILNETQAEIRGGTHARIFDRTVMPRRAEIEDVAVRQLRAVLADESTRDRLGHLLRVNLDTAVRSSSALRAVPLPDAVLRPLVRSVGEVIVQGTVQTIADSLETDEGRAALRDLVASVLDQVLHGSLRDEIESLSASVAVDVIEDMKDAVRVKKWAARPAEDR